MFSLDVVWTNWGPIYVEPGVIRLAIIGFGGGLFFGSIWISINHLRILGVANLYRKQAAWIVMGILVVLPLINEDLTGLVYADQNMIVDHLAAIGTLLGLKGLWGLRERFYRQLDIEQVKVLIERTYET